MFRLQKCEESVNKVKHYPNYAVVIVIIGVYEFSFEITCVMFHMFLNPLAYKGHLWIQMGYLLVPESSCVMTFVAFCTCISIFSLRFLILWLSASLVGVEVFSITNIIYQLLHVQLNRERLRHFSIIYLLSLQFI